MFSHAPGGTQAAEEIPLVGRSLHETGLQELEEASLHSSAHLSLSFLQCLVGPLPLQHRQRFLSEPTALASRPASVLGFPLLLETLL